jgi:hypothetical protein
MALRAGDRLDEGVDLSGQLADPGRPGTARAGLFGLDLGEQVTKAAQVEAVAERLDGWRLGSGLVRRPAGRVRRR